MSISLSRIVEGQLTTVSLKEKYWDAVLTPSTEKPCNRWPLAPSDKVEAGEVTDESYQVQNDRFSMRTTEVMVKELAKMSATRGFEQGPKGVEILGAGLMRTLHWLGHSAKIPFFPTRITDVSGVACQNAITFLDQQQIFAVHVKQAEVGEMWKSGDIDEEDVLFYFAALFMQNQTRRDKNKMMRHFGNFLTKPTRDGRLRRAVYLVHARGEDNPPDKVKWKNTIPYFDKELRTPLQEGGGGPVRMEPIATHLYWHQCYTFFKLSAPDMSG